MRNAMLLGVLRLAVFAIAILSAPRRGNSQPPPAAPNLTTPEFLSVEELPPIGMELPVEIPSGSAESAGDGPVISEEVIVPAEPVKTWSGSVELGTNGASGNSEMFDLQFGGHLERDVPTSILTLDLNYNFGHSNSQRNANRLFTEERWEFLFPGSPWTYFIHQTNEFDEFRAFDVRIAGDTGLGYHILDSKATKLSTRVGMGASSELGGPQDEVVPEALWGLSYQRRLTPRQKVKATLDVFPDVSDFGDFRANAKADWEILLDERHDLKLKIGLSDRYDSTPNGALRNDVNYSAVILWGF